MRDLVELKELVRWLELLREFAVRCRDFRPHEVLPSGRPQGTVCIAYLAWPFREGFDSPRARGHTNAFEVVAMAEAWAREGFRVIVGDYRDPNFHPEKEARVVLDLHGRLEAWKAEMRGEPLLIHHATGCHWLEQNLAEMNRLIALRNRRGVTLTPRRQVASCRNAETAAFITCVGNEYTLQTYAFAGKPIRRIRLSSAFELQWPEGRHWNEARRRFLWMGSFGMVHKGLDLVLEAFAQLPELQLTVCGRPEKEADFFELYRRELTMLPNIRMAGWVSPDSKEFAEIARTHAAIIYPSSSEGGGGAVIHAMHAGLLPVCTREASVDLGDFGVLVTSGTVEAVRDAVMAVAEMAPPELEERARIGWDHVRRSHNRKSFRADYENFVTEVSRGL